MRAGGRDEDVARGERAAAGFRIEAARGRLPAALRLGDHEQTLRPPAPGMLARHYATDTPMHLDPQGVPAGRIGWLGLGCPSTPGRFAAVESLSEQGDLVEAAASLFEARVVGAHAERTTLDVEVEVDDRVVKVTNPDRVYFPPSNASPNSAALMKASTKSSRP